MIEEKPLVWCWEEVLAEPHDIAFDARLRRQIVSFLRVARCTDGDNEHSQATPERPPAWQLCPHLPLVTAEKKNLRNGLQLCTVPEQQRALPYSGRLSSTPDMGHVPQIRHARTV